MHTGRLNDLCAYFLEVGIVLLLLWLLDVGLVFHFGTAAGERLLKPLGSAKSSSRLRLNAAPLPAGTGNSTNR